MPKVTRLMSASLALLLAAVFVSLSAQLSFPIPGTHIPQTGQTLAVLAVGALLGARLGALAILLYLLFGVLGLPVYSDGASGWAVLFGSSKGYFMGFVVAAALVGWIVRQLENALLLRTALLLAAMLMGHFVILLCGFLGLAWDVGIDTAWAQGVVPFVYGGLVKSVITLFLVLLVEPLRPVISSQLGSPS